MAGENGRLARVLFPTAMRLILAKPSITQDPAEVSFPLHMYILCMCECVWSMLVDNLHALLLYVSVSLFCPLPGETLTFHHLLTHTRMVEMTLQVLYKMLVSAEIADLHAELTPWQFCDLHNLLLNAPCCITRYRGCVRAVS